MRIVLPLILLLTLASSGCTSYQKRTYEISVRNDSSKPVVVWLTKSGDPYEVRWASPEDLAIESPRATDRSINWVTIDPGKSADSGAVEGLFLSNTRAILRIYIDAQELSDLLSMPPESATRVDLELDPGPNSFIINPGPALSVSRITAR